MNISIYLIIPRAHLLRTYLMTSPYRHFEWGRREKVLCRVSVVSIFIYANI